MLASLAPAAGAVPRAPAGVSLTSAVELRGSRSASVDVRVTRDVRIDEVWDARPATFDSTAVGSGFALVSLDYAYDPPTVIGLMTPGGARARRLVVAFGDDRRGNQILVTQVLPRGRYRLYLITSGPATVRFGLKGLRGGTTALKPARPERVGLRRVDSPVKTSYTGEVLAHAYELIAEQNIAFVTVSTIIRNAPHGYDSFSCMYRGGPPPGGVYLPRCLNASFGLGTANNLPIIGEFDYLGFGAFSNLPGGKWAMSRSINAPGEVIDQTSYFVWLPMPLGTPSPDEPRSTRPSGPAATLPGGGAARDAVPAAVAR